MEFFLFCIAQAICLCEIFKLSWSMPLAYSTYNCPANINTGNTHLVFEKVCYEFVLNRKEYWDGARHDCNNRGGDLALVKSYDVQYYLQTTLQKLNVGNKAVWIGLNDRHHEGHFVWVDGSPLTYSHWAVHEGNGFLRLTQDCAQIHMGDHGLWHDRECHLWPNKFSYICQFPTVETVHTVKPKIPTTTRSSTRSATVQTKMASTTKPSTATFPTTTTTLSSTTMSKPKTEYPSPTTIFHQYPTTTELPKQEYPITTTHLPKQEYPITSTHLSEKEYPVTTEHLSEREYPITTKLPDREYPISTTPEPDREYPVTTKYLPDREFPIRSTLLPEREYPITTPQLLDREYPTTTTSLPDKETKTKLMPIQEYPATTAMKQISSNKDSGNGHFLTPAP